MSTCDEMLLLLYQRDSHDLVSFNHAFNAQFLLLFVF